MWATPSSETELSNDWQKDEMIDTKPFFKNTIPTQLGVLICFEGI